jgi:hypothetical protein
MKHPDQQTWVDYLYGELDLNTRSLLKRHLAECETCRVQVNQWRDVQQRLSTWQLPQSTTRSSTVPAFPTLARWVAAALLLIAVGYGIGRSAGPAPGAVAALRAELRGELAELIELQMVESTAATLVAAQEQTAAAMGDLIDFYQAERLADNRAIATAFSRLDAARAADFMSLRQDLETVALNSDVGLRQTRQQLVRLADYSQGNMFTPPN